MNPKRKCRGCSVIFFPKKVFYYYCFDCFKLLAKCSHCSKTVFPKDGFYSCCGNKNSVDEVNDSSSQRKVRSEIISESIYNMIGDSATNGLFDYDDDLFLNPEDQIWDGIY